MRSRPAGAVLGRVVRGMRALDGRGVGLDPIVLRLTEVDLAAVWWSICGSNLLPLSVPKSRAQIRATIATSLSMSSAGGASRPREACTALIESSTVTRCSTPPRRSRSVRPRVGRMIARLPVTTCERFSFVDTCTVRSTLRSAASTTFVSGVAETKLPPIAMKTRALPSRIARIASTVS